MGNRTTKNRQKASLKKDAKKMLSKFFVRNLLNWNKKKNKRQMPWKGEKDPYKIWLSEIILQQTRVEQGLKYYENFVRSFPNVHALAKAPEEKVFKLWEGLGYYSRCKNLLVSARYISEELKGVFPNRFQSILELKGVGSYTASAIASFAYNLPYAVLDGNVFRVLSRIFDIETPVDSIDGKKQFSRLAQEILPKQKAAEYNQAVMDFGALVCKPYPECRICFMNDHCRAFLSGKQDLLPVKEKTIRVKERWLNYVVIKCGNEILIRQRTVKDIWQQLFEFLLMETEKSVNSKKILNLFEKQYGFRNYKLIRSQAVDQKLSHQLVHFCFIEIEIQQKEIIPDFVWVKKPRLKKYAFPKTLKHYVLSYLS